MDWLSRSLHMLADYSTFVARYLVFSTSASLIPAKCSIRPLVLAHQGQSELEVYSKITRLEYKIPDFFSSEASELISKLLNPVPEKRLGNLRHGGADIQAEPWFNQFDFNDLHDGKILAPHVRAHAHYHTSP